MNRNKHRIQLFHTIAGIALLIVFCVSLVLPYSSEYFHRETVVAAKAGSPHSEQLQLVNALQTNPIDRTLTETIRIVRIQDDELFRLAENLLASRFILINRTVGMRIQVCLGEPSQWHPSIVIALRRLLI